MSPLSLPKSVQIALPYFEKLGWEIHHNEEDLAELIRPSGHHALYFESGRDLWRHWRSEFITLQRWSYIFEKVDAYAQESSKNKRWVEAWLIDSRKSKFNAVFNRIMQAAHRLEPSAMFYPGWIKDAPNWASNAELFDREKWVENLKAYLVEKERERLNTSLPLSSSPSKSIRL